MEFGIQLNLLWGSNSMEFGIQIPLTLDVTTHWNDFRIMYDSVVVHRVPVMVL